MKNIMKIAGIVGAVLLGTSVVQAGVVTNVWSGNSNADVGDNNNWTGFQSPDGFATTPDVNGDTHIGIIDADGVNAPVVSWGGQINNTVLEVNNTATLAQTVATLNAVGTTLVLNDSSLYNAAGKTMAWGQNAGNASTLTLNDSAGLSALHLQVGKISQGVVNQNGGSVVLSGDLRLSLDNSASPASRYNLASGTVTVAGAFSIGGADAGTDGGSYFNFTPDSAGSITIMSAGYNFAGKIDAGQIRLGDTAYASSNDIWLIDSSVSGQTTLSLNPYPGLIAQFWTGNANSALGDNGNWSGTGNPIGAAGTKIGVIDDNGANAPEISFGGQLNDTQLEVNNSAVLTYTNNNLNANGAILTLNDNAAYNNTGWTIKWGQTIAGKTSTLTINDNASVSSLHFQLGNIGQGIVNQNGGTVDIAADFRIGQDTNAATASRYNLSAGTVTVGDEFDFGGTDAGADNGTYFNFTAVGAGFLTVQTNGYDFAARIDSGEIRYQDVVYSSGSVIWNIDTSVPGQTTLSVVSGPPSGYAGWIANYPGVGTATSLTDNPDGDALDNLAEWAMGGNPDDIEDIGHVPTFTATEAGGTNYFEYVYAQRSDADELGLSYYLEQTVNLTVPAWTNDNIEVVSTNFTGLDFDYVTNRISSDVESVQFLQLIIESN